MRPRVFPAEDLPGRPSGRPTLAGFNEAAGIPRGRRSVRNGVQRHIAGFNEAAGIPRGRLSLDELARFRTHASMRPRVFPAEDAMSTYVDAEHLRASMRPRVFPAEDKGVGSVTGLSPMLQ